MSSPEQEAARYQQQQERENHLRRLREEKIIEATFLEFPSRFKIPNGEVLRALGTVKFDADGQPLAGGVPLATALENYAQVNRHAVAGSLAETHDKGLSSVRSKADLKDIAAKVAYVNAHGEALFARLPTTPPVAFDEASLTFESYRKLPVRTKVLLCEKYGPNFSATLSRANQEQERLDRLSGTPVKKK